MAPRKWYAFVGPEMRAYIKFCQRVNSAIDLSKETNVSRTHIYRLWNDGITFEKKRKTSTDRPPKIGERTVRLTSEKG